MHNAIVRNYLKPVIKNAIADWVYLSVYKCIHIIKINYKSLTKRSHGKSLSIVKICTIFIPRTKLGLFV